ncbi:hypothetical protein QN400_24375 [Pseudomonas sp. RTC3]|uniref:hypothetical protein n=1 Tax=unclassified Pseudomonas TaxID=196821 RepID=UPI002AB55C99|nr:MULTISPECIES: hypothetical protein [unclassified Pseudomonas]MEB0065142.1 hypothetical protein [Pseudomonas sp. RTC3]MDY7565346.1 hypothetical protein [Pseudomonas sp. 5C2]MEB0009823.1 hypothetical protein [Pseudomonas sp. RTB2]MEB0015971.1 hypothetical protein [Pseudomonas sp. RTB3]MEB0026265.1 hypothetical protein [Pseudomonas sp. MH9.2]
MKARIEKKLSKRLVEIAPSIFAGVWIDKDEPSELAYKQRTRVSHVYPPVKPKVTKTRYTLKL